jgi:hypothetical protein
MTAGFTPAFKFKLKILLAELERRHKKPAATRRIVQTPGKPG